MSSRPRPLIGEARLRARVAELGRRIARAYRGEELVMVGVLNGAFIFLADLARRTALPLKVEFLRVQSYDGAHSSGAVRVELELTQSIRGRHVLLVEDIIDTGLTALAVRRLLEAQHPRSLRVCALLSKPSRRRVEVPIDFVGFEVPDTFVVGYGLDYRGRYRSLPYLATV